MSTSKSGTPASISYSRSNSTNGVLSNLTFTIIPNNYIDVYDIITISLKEPLHFENSSRCYGDGYWVGVEEIRCKVQGNMRVVDVEMAVAGRYWDYNWTSRWLEQEDEHSESKKRRLYEELIPGNSPVIITLSDIRMPPTLRPLNVDTLEYWLKQRVTYVVLENKKMSLDFTPK